MISRYIKNIAMAGIISLTATACLTDLELSPENEITSENIYGDFGNYRNVLAKLYGGYSLTGQAAGTGDQDVQGIDEGASAYFRTYWNLQELPTDEALLAWTGDPGVNPLNLMTWSSNNQLTRAMYYRIYYQITLANEFIRETSEEMLNERGITGTNLEEARRFRAEARFLRALSYWHALDLYGNVPFVTEEQGVGLYFPEQIQPQQLFEYIESELLSITDGADNDDLVDARQNEYGRADKGAAWTLLAKLYLNAEVYTGSGRYDEVITYAENVINAGYELEDNYHHLFLADNDLARNEIILPVIADGVEARTYGNATYIAHAAVGGSIDAADLGLNGGWFGLRATSGLVNLFEDVSGETDSRAIFWTDGQQLEIEDVSTFTQGYPVIKYKNITSAGEPGKDPGLEFVDIDYPLFRLADVYLMYAEAVLRGGAGGDEATALSYVNLLRQRAYGDDSGNVSSLDLQFILDERGRELHWEGHRRTDLIRYGLFTGGEYLWPWKGGVPEGTSVGAYRRLYPLPVNDITANPNLEQNPGY